MKQRVSLAFAFVLAVGVLTAPLLANQMSGMDDDKMSGMGMMDKMMSGMGKPDKDEMKMMMDKMMAMPAAERKKAMQKMGSMGKPTAGKMSGMSAADKKKVAACCSKGMKPAGMKPDATHMSMCCMGGMDKGKMMSGMSAAQKDKMGMCCSGGMKAAGMKPGDMKMGDMSKMPGMDKMTSGMSAMDKSEMMTMMDKMMAMPPAKRKQAMEKMCGMGKKPADKSAGPSKMSDGRHEPHS